jgi:hypothetical protein
MSKQGGQRTHRWSRVWLLATGWAAMGFVPGMVFAGGHGSHASPAVEEEIDLPSDMKVMGIELGEFRIRTYYPVEAQKSTVRFILYGAVAIERAADARHVLELRRQKLRDEIITATRMAPLLIFNEAGLASFRRRVMVRLRRALPELPIDDVYLSEFQLMVKSL